MQWELAKNEGHIVKLQTILGKMKDGFQPKIAQETRYR